KVRSTVKCMISENDAVIGAAVKYNIGVDYKPDSSNLNNSRCVLEKCPKLSLLPKSKLTWLLLTMSTPCPFTDDQEIATKATIAHHQIRRAIQTRDRNEHLVHAYYLDSILDVASRNQLANLRNMISRHYFIEATRTYYLFERLGVEQPYRTSISCST
ncbi:4019_t:CDS:2, partial [Racocetra persica]